MAGIAPMPFQKCAVLASLLYVCLFLLAGPVESQNPWLHALARNFCDLVAQEEGVDCNCVDIQIIPGQGDNLCRYQDALGPGIAAENSQFMGFVNHMPPPDTALLLATTCDARNSAIATLTCTSTGLQTVSSEVTTTYTVGLGYEVMFGFDLDFLRGEEHFTLTFESSTSQMKGATLSASNTCGPGGTGQPAGTCAIYNENYNSYNFQDGQDFKYDTLVSGGVQMSFSKDIDLKAAIGQEGDGSKHFYWYLRLGSLLLYAQEVVINNADLFTVDTTDLTNPVTFHGTATMSGTFLDVTVDCTVASCS